MYQLIINFKTYNESLGENAVKIAKNIAKLKKIAEKKNVRIIACPQIIDLRDIQKLKVPVFSQHFEDYNPGAHTGFITPESLISAKAIGSLINHSEHRLKEEKIKEDIKKAKKLGLEICLCVKNAKEVDKYQNLKPDFIAVEPPELIGGDISISTAKPELISKCVKNAKKTPLLIGAGVKNSQDVKKGIELGAKGILVASGVVKVEDSYLAIKELLEGFN